MKFRRLAAALLSAVMAVTALLPVTENHTEGADKYNTASVTAEAAEVMRRPCDAEHPMLIVHIDTWNYADPEKIIALIPDDLKPYCVFNVSMSINWSSTEHRWLMTQDGYELAKSWIRSCADAGVWTMIQPSSGGQCHFPDYDSGGDIVKFPNQSSFVQKADEDYENTVFAEFFRDYPNFIGYNYCEQFWGFESADFPVTPMQRYEHFANLLKLCNRYGGYLNISWCANQWSAGLNPVAMLKKNTRWREACENYTENLQLVEKYTQTSMINDVESEVFGAYVSGYCGNFGVRYDDTGWTDLGADDSSVSEKNQYRVSTSIPIHLERFALNGATIIDGPELIWNDDFKEVPGKKDSDGYTARAWEMYDQYQNDILDLFRKITDGTIRIPDREEVIERTKVVVIQDVDSGSDTDKYCSYPSLFEGLYRMPSDGNHENNHNLFKSTGRYPTVPTVYALRDDIAKGFQVQIKQSEIPSRWSGITAKQDEFDKLFPSEYVGNCYAARIENSWVTYNPDKRGENRGAILGLKYNTCESLDVNFNAYGTAFINEYPDHIDIYANNYDEDAKTTLRTDTFKVNGCASEPSYTASDRGVNQTKSEITENFADGTYTLTVKHNGPVDISIECGGNETDRLTSYKKAKVATITQPPLYEGVRQYEAENFDTKNTEGNITNACTSDVTGIHGMGFLKFGKGADAAVKDTVKTRLAGDFDLSLRYSCTSDTENVDLFVNGAKVKALKLANTNSYSNWKTVTETVTLESGENTIEFKANSALPGSLYIDCITVEGKFGEAGSNMSGTYITQLAVNDKENASDWGIYEEFDDGSYIYGDRDITVPDVPALLYGLEYVRTACDSKMYESDLAQFIAGKDMTAYVAADPRVSPMLTWLGTWTKRSEVLELSDGLVFEIYKKDLEKGEKCILGTNGGSGNSANYIVFGGEKEPEPLSGRLIKDLTVYDRENAVDWSINSAVGNGAVQYGDRAFTLDVIPDELIGAEAVITACDSKMFPKELAGFRAAQDITVYVAVDTRAAESPGWLSDWVKTDRTVINSNKTEFVLYKKNANKDDEIILGTNGGNADLANYTVMAVPYEAGLRGDVNADGIFNLSDAVLFQKWIINAPGARLDDWKAADLTGDGWLDSIDLCLMKNGLISE